MGIRESLNDRRGLVAAVVAGFIVLCIWFLVRTSRSDNFLAGSANAFFTTDDGRTWFTDDSKKLPPFDYNGKPAYGCRVFTCDGGKTKFVGYLERYPPEVLESLRQHSNSTPSNAIASLMLDALEVKPAGTGEHNWLKHSDRRAWSITAPKCPDNSGRRAMPVEP